MARTSGVFRRIIQLIVDAKTVRQTKAALQDALNKGTDAKGVKKNLTAVDRALLTIKRTALGLAGSFLAVFSARRIIEMADSWKLIQGRLKIVTDGAQDLGRVTEDLLAISNRTRSSFEATAILFQRISLQAEELGRSESQILRLTETLNKAIQLGGANAVEARAGVIQFSQALSSGTLRGDEFRSMMENLPGVARALADGLDVPVGALREMAFAGELTAQRVTDALLKMSQKVDEDFKNLPVTVGGAFTVLGNSLMEFIGVTDEATGSTGLFAQTLLDVAGAVERINEAIDKAKGGTRDLPRSLENAWADTGLRPVTAEDIERFRRARGIAPGGDLGQDIEALRFQMAQERAAGRTPEALLQELLSRLESDRVSALVKLKAASRASQAEIEELNRLYAEGNRFLDRGNLSVEQRGRLIAALSSLGFEEGKAKAAEDALKLEDQRISLLREAIDLEVASKEEVAELAAIEARFKKALEDGNVPLEQRVRLTEHLKDIAESLAKAARDPFFRTVPTQMDELLRGGVPAIHEFPEDSLGRPVIRARDIGGFGDDDRRKVIEDWLSAHQEMQNAAENAAMGVANAWADAFEAIAIQGEGFAGFFEALMRGAAGAALGGLTQVASIKVAENIAHIFEQKALAAAATAAAVANPLAAGYHLSVAAGHIAAAKTFGLAAAKWAVLGGAGAAAQGAISGGGRGGRSGGLPSGARDPAGRLADRFQPSNTIIIQNYVDGIDPKNGVHQEKVGNAYIRFEEREGARLTRPRRTT